MNYKKAMDKFLIEYEAAKWNISEACRKTTITRFTYYSWYKKCPKFRLKIHEQQEAILDQAESILHKQLDKDNVSVAQYLLEKKGKDRGYGATQEQNHSGDFKIEIVKRVLKGKDDKGTGDND